MQEAVSDDTAVVCDGSSGCDDGGNDNLAIHTHVQEAVSGNTMSQTGLDGRTLLEGGSLDGKKWQKDCRPVDQHAFAEEVSVQRDDASLVRFAGQNACRFFDNGLDFQNLREIGLDGEKLQEAQGDEAADDGQTGPDEQTLLDGGSLDGEKLHRSQEAAGEQPSCKELQDNDVPERGDAGEPALLDDVATCAASRSTDGGRAVTSRVAEIHDRIANIVKDLNAKVLRNGKLKALLRSPGSRLRAKAEISTLEAELERIATAGKVQEEQPYSGTSVDDDVPKFGEDYTANEPMLAAIRAMQLAAGTDFNFEKQLEAIRLKQRDSADAYKEANGMRQRLWDHTCAIQAAGVMDAAECKHFADTQLEAVRQVLDRSADAKGEADALCVELREWQKEVIRKAEDHAHRVSIADATLKVGKNGQIRSTPLRPRWADVTDEDDIGDTAATAAATTHGPKTYRAAIVAMERPWM